MRSQDNKVGVHCCVLAAVLAYTMGWWQWNEVEVWGKHEWVTDMCLSSQIPVSPTHIQWCLLSVILLGLTSPRNDDFIVPLFPKRFPCVSFTSCTLSLVQSSPFIQCSWQTTLNEQENSLYLLFHHYWWLLNAAFPLKDALKHFKQYWILLVHVKEEIINPSSRFTEFPTAIHTYQLGLNTMGNQDPGVYRNHCLQKLHFCSQQGAGNVMLILPPYLSRNLPSHGSATGMRLHGREKHTHRTKCTQRWGNKAKDKLYVEEKENYTTKFMWKKRRITLQKLKKLKRNSWIRVEGNSLDLI